MRQVSLNNKPVKLFEHQGKTIEAWQEKLGVGNGDCIISKNEEEAKFGTLFYDGLPNKGTCPFPSDINILKVKLSMRIPVFKIRYQPRSSC